MTLTDTAILPGVALATLRRAILAEAEDHGLTVLQDDGAGLTLRSIYGDMHFATGPEGCAITLTAAQPEPLQTLRDSVVFYAGALAPDAAQALRWSDGAGPGLPANARLMQVASVEPMDCGFLRVTLSGDARRFGDGAIHFRLGLPPEGRRPVWPSVGANGATLWPKGADALHLPVYTARAVTDTRLVFDVFRHEGGRTTLWAESAPVGAEVLVVGPGGGGCHVEGRILAHVDDTAFPAIARILAANPDLVGEVNLYPSHAAAGRYPFPEHAGVRLIHHDDPEHLGDDACAALDPQSYPWLAGERRHADRLRKQWKRAGGNARQSYIAAYWQG